MLAAGAYGSPQLLMLSGVGPAAVLQQHGLPVQVDAPEVGENLQDHPVLPVVYRTRSRDTLKSAESLLEVLRYLVFKRGMLASGGVEGFAFTQVHPGPVAAPAIDPGLLSDPDGIDASVLWEGVRLARRIAATSPLAEWNVGELRPGVSVQSDRDLLDYAGTELQTVYHPTSSCRMGSDARAVIDPQLRVRGIDGLWIADASVMPSIPRGHPNAVVAMIAERAAGWIESAIAR